MLKINITKPLVGSSGEMMLSVDTAIKKGGFVAISGESGSGKTTLLRVLAGLDDASGSIKIEDQTWLGTYSAVSPQNRSIGFVFQNYALFPNMSVEGNLLYISKDTALANELMEITGLTSLRKRRPNSLSGGQQQRVALCRAMMNKPKLLLLDEPLSALNPSMRTQLQQEILTLHSRFNTTTLMVSHDPSEIYRMADRVIVLDQGKVVSDGKPKEVLLQAIGSQKFSFVGELLEIKKIDVVAVAIVAIGQQIAEVVIGSKQASVLNIGDRVTLSTKAFAPTLAKIEP